MKSPDGNYFNIGRGLAFTLAILIAVILGGNGLVIFQFERARLETERPTGVSHQLIAVLRLQESLVSFHQRLNELAEARDADRLVTEAMAMRAALLEQARETRSSLAYLPRGFRVDPAFLTALDAIEITLPAQLREVTAMARVGDWGAVRLRVDNELKGMEASASALVKSFERDLDEELPRAVANMRDVQRRILFFVPATAVATVIIAVFFGWAITRRVILLRMEERVNERIRIARDLHDTLLQSFQGALMMFDGFAERLPEGSETRTMLDGIIECARRAVREGRDAVQGLRSSTVITNDLAGAISALGMELSAERGGDPGGKGHPEFRVHVEGASRDLAPLVRDEIHRITREVVGNAFRHAEAGLIEVEIQYTERELRLRVRDDGKGIAPEILAAGGRAGHYGLSGMRERAKLLGGTLAVGSTPGAGTEAEVIVPAAFAYQRPQRPRRPMASGKEA